MTLDPVIIYAVSISVCLATAVTTAVGLWYFRWIFGCSICFLRHWKVFTGDVRIADLDCVTQDGSGLGHSVPPIWFCLLLSVKTINYNVETWYYTCRVEHRMAFIHCFVHVFDKSMMKLFEKHQAFPNPHFIINTSSLNSHPWIHVEILLLLNDCF